MSIFKTINKQGTGQFVQYVQYVNIFGLSSIDPKAGMITYSSQMLCKFSCLYLKQFLLNNPEMARVLHASSVFAG